MSALDTQIAGSHYKKYKIQPMEYSMANGLDACQHTAIKYITRFRDKGGIEDLEKAKHCIDMLIEFERKAALPNSFDKEWVPYRACDPLPGPGSVVDTIDADGHVTLNRVLGEFSWAGVTGYRVYFEEPRKKAPPSVPKLSPDESAPMAATHWSPSDNWWVAKDTDGGYSKWGGVGWFPIASYRVTIDWVSQLHPIG